MRPTLDDVRVDVEDVLEEWLSGYVYGQHDRPERLIRQEGDGRYRWEPLAHDPDPWEPVRVRVRVVVEEVTA